MKKLTAASFLVAAALFFISCSDNLTDPSETGNPAFGDYIWKTDTIHNSIFFSWGASPGELWFTDGFSRVVRLKDGKSEVMLDESGSHYYGLCGAGNDVFVYGENYINHFDGSKWNKTAFPPDLTVWDMAGDGKGKFIVVGGYNFSDPNNLGAILCFNGGQWEQAGPENYDGDFTAVYFDKKKDAFIIHSKKDEEGPRNFYFNVFNDNELRVMYRKDQNSNMFFRPFMIGGEALFYKEGELYNLSYSGFSPVINLGKKYTEVKFAGRSREDIYSLNKVEGLYHFNGEQYAPFFTSGNEATVADFLLFDDGIVIIERSSDRSSYFIHAGILRTDYEGEK